MSLVRLRGPFAVIMHIEPRSATGAAVVADWQEGMVSQIRDVTLPSLDATTETLRSSGHQFNVETGFNPVVMTMNIGTHEADVLASADRDIRTELGPPVVTAPPEIIVVGYLLDATGAPGSRVAARARGQYSLGENTWTQQRANAGNALTLNQRVQQFGLWDLAIPATAPTSVDDLVAATNFTDANKATAARFYDAIGIERWQNGLKISDAEYDRLGAGRLRP